MDARQADELLTDVELIEAVKGPMMDIKRLREQCLEADIPSAFERCKGTS